MLGVRSENLYSVQACRARGRLRGGPSCGGDDAPRGESGVEALPKLRAPGRVACRLQSHDVRNTSCIPFHLRNPTDLDFATGVSAKRNSATSAAEHHGRAVSAPNSTKSASSSERRRSSIGMVGAMPMLSLRACASIMSVLGTIMLTSVSMVSIAARRAVILCGHTSIAAACAEPRAAIDAGSSELEA